MKQKLKKIINESLKAAFRADALPVSEFPEIEVEDPNHSDHGDFSTNIAMKSARSCKMAPRKIAEAVLEHFEDDEGIVEKAEIAGPGFINFFMNQTFWAAIVKDIYEQGETYGACDFGKGRRLQVEFVSANPTGPLHAGHGRGAAVGDCLGNILAFCGFDVEKEYYINDSGRQINTLGVSVFLRYKELCGEKIDFPEDCYQGEYVREIAGEIKEKALLEDQSEEDAVTFCGGYAAEKIFNGIKADLQSFGVKYDNLFSEQSLYDAGKVESVADELRKKGMVYERDGAVWFKSTLFGDEKDRVIKRQNGLTTYFASDIAYHRDKFRRGFDRVVDVWGADHHGYIPRVRAAVKAVGHDENCFDVVLVQLVNLLRAGKPAAMSTRGGEYVSLKDLIDEVGKDAARFIFLSRHHESPLDFDLEAAKAKSADNPVYYVQYVHARISSIMGKGREAGVCVETCWDESKALFLKEPEETELIKALGGFPEVVETAGRLMEPHRLVFYLVELASLFHSYYTKHRVLAEDRDLAQGRLLLGGAVKRIIKTGLSLTGVSAPEKM